MKYLMLIVSSFMFMQTGECQSLSSTQLLDNSIKYHDPESKWQEFKGTLYFDQLDTKRNLRGKRTATLDLPNEHFQLIQTRGGETIIREIKGEECMNKYNGNSNISEEIRSKHQLTCERAKMYRNYYSYLYGLPMKLKDPGTIIHPEVSNSDFEGVECYSIKVTYEKEVGEDTWYFYFDKNTYAMIGYRFYHDESKNDGEYITLEGEINVNGILIPRDRYWYTHKEDKFLGADLLINK